MCCIISHYVINYCSLPYLEKLEAKSQKYLFWEFYSNKRQFFVQSKQRNTRRLVLSNRMEKCYKKIFRTKSFCNKKTRSVAACMSALIEHLHHYYWHNMRVYMGICCTCTLFFIMPNDNKAFIYLFIQLNLNSEVNTRRGAIKVLKYPSKSWSLK